MIQEVLDQGFVSRQLDGIRAALETGKLDDAAESAVRVTQLSPDEVAPATAVLASMPLAGAGPVSSGGDETGAAGVPFFARDPIVSLLQTTLEDELRNPARGAVLAPLPTREADVSEIVGATESLIDPEQFGPHDPRWVTEVGTALLARVAKGNHPFNPDPAETELRDDARIILVGDWGTGIPRARAVAGFMAEEVREASADGRQVAVIHLGDVYYSGDENEYDSRVLVDGLWPVTVEQAQRSDPVTSWALSGNHDMYSGGWAYFDHLLADPRFFAQRSPDGKSTSYVRLTSPSWEIIGLDTAWDPDPLAMGHHAVLEDPQGAFVQRVAGESDRKLLLLSHHQLISVYDQNDIARTLPTKLAAVLAGRRVTAWFWGHEHRCMGFEPAGGVRFPRCIGHGGVPARSHPEATPIPLPGAWEERGHFDAHGQRWGRFGFAVLDLAPTGEMHVRYRDDSGRQVRAEAIA